MVIKGRIPSKKNSTITMCRNGRALHFPSNPYRTWHKDASSQLIGQKAIPTPCKLIIDFWFPDARKTDLSNKTESIMDLLVDNGIIPDDNCLEIPQLLLIYRGIDRLNPRAEIKYEPITS